MKPSPPRGTVRQSVRVGAALALWLMGLVAFWVYATYYDAGAVAVLQRWLQRLATSAWGPLLLAGLYLLRPLLLLPITILNVFAGFLLGPVWGLGYATLATLASSSLAYGVARSLAQSRTPTRARPSELSGGWLERLRAHGFETVLSARLALLPGDLVNYAAGALAVPFPAFALATVVGGLPGLAVSVLAGASFEGTFRFQGVRLNPWFLAASAALLGSSLLASRYLRARASAPEAG